MSIIVHIERLILEGLPTANVEGPLVQQGLERELTRLLAAGGLARDVAAGRGVADASANPMRMPRAGDSRQLGQQIARSVYEAIGDERPHQRPTGRRERGNVS